MSVRHRRPPPSLRGSPAGAVRTGKRKGERRQARKAENVTDIINVRFLFSKHAGHWVGVGSVVIFAVFLGFRAAHLRRLQAMRALASDKTKLAVRGDASLKLPGPDSRPAPNSHIMALSRDPLGCIWLGTEDDGVFRYDPDAAPDAQWTQFTTNDGLGDNNAYSIACDKQGRVWAGELNHGVAVFNGLIWKNYDILDGPIGERVFRIAVCPTDGDVWIATSAGLTRYSPDLDTWRYYTRADGLPSDQANALAFDASGNLYVGTQCDGIAIGSAADGYKNWRLIRGPDDLPTNPAGPGLPSALINDLLVSRDRTIYAATTAGLAFSADSGQNWQYIRGGDYKAKLQGMAEGAPPQEGLSVSYSSSILTLPEDFITCLAEDDNTNLWIGFRTQGCSVLNPKADTNLMRNSRRAGELRDNFVTALLPGQYYNAYVGTYGGGVTMPEIAPFEPVPQETVLNCIQTPLPPFPSPAKPPGLSELAAMLDKVKKACGNQTNLLSTNQPSAVYLGQDWRTQGDWMGRYGNMRF